MKCVAVISLFVLLAVSAQAQTRPADASTDPTAAAICIWGGGPVNDEVTSHFRKIAGEKPIAIVRNPNSDKDAGEWTTKARPGEQIIEPQQLDKALAGARGKAAFGAIWIDVPLQEAKPLEPTLQKFVKAGGSLGGRLAGLDILDQVRIAPQNGVPATQPVPMDRGLVLEVPPQILVTINGRKISVMGKSEALWHLPAAMSTHYGAAEPVISQSAPQSQDLIALIRTVAARRNAAFPRETPSSPILRKGSLILGGGGELPDAVWERFLTLAGGRDANILVITTAQPDPLEPNPKGPDRLKALGAKHVTLFGHRNNVDAENPEFLNALAHANGVWLVGGRQWRYVDAYEQTRVVALLQSVLSRGGVIGGTSAGAAIQAELMVRGSPLNNRILSAEGYRQGFSFLPGTTIDIHVAQRNRLNEFTALVRQSPQYLGIAIDEDTAAEVRGQELTVMGSGSVHIIDGRSTKETVSELKRDDKFDLLDRTRITTPRPPAAQTR